MAELTLDVARKILDAALAMGVEKKLKPLVVTILDARGCVKVTAAQDGTSLMRAEIAHGKAAHADNNHKDGANAIWALSKFVDASGDLLVPDNLAIEIAPFWLVGGRTVELGDMQRALVLYERALARGAKDAEPDLERTRNVLKVPR